MALRVGRGSVVVCQVDSVALGETVEVVLVCRLYRMAVPVVLITFGLG
jgi:hypothetical protein